MLPRRYVKAHRVLVMNHYSVGTVVHPAFIRIAGDIDASGSDITPAIKFMPSRRRKFQQIDLFVSENILEQRTLFDHLGRDGLDLLITVLPSTHEIHLGLAGGEVQRKRKSFS